MKGPLGIGMRGFLLVLGVQMLLVCVMAVCCVSCSTFPVASTDQLNSIISTVSPIVIDIIAAKEQSRAAREQATAALKNTCKHDLINASLTAVHLLSEYKAIEGKKAFMTQDERLSAWQMAYVKTSEWYRSLYNETPEQLVIRLYECANAKPPKDMGWEFYATIALRHLGYNVTPGDITTIDLPS